MKGDFSRISFNRAKHFGGVLHQQGRVWLDSDWNEDVFERLDQEQQELYDVVGPCGVPYPGTAFQISPGPDPAHPENFAIGGGGGVYGRAYVQGLLCRMDAPTTYFTQPDFLDAPPVQFPQDGSDHYAMVYLEAWRRLITTLEDSSLSEVALGGPDTSTRIQTVAQVKALLVPVGTSCSDLPSFLPLTDATLTVPPPPEPGSTPSTTSDLCSLPDAVNYTGSENHLYRVEIHTGGSTVGTGVAGMTLAVNLAQDAAAGATVLNLASPLTTQQIASITLWGGMLTLNDEDGRAEQIQIETVPISGTLLVLASPLVNAFTVARAAMVLGLAQFKWSRDNGTAATSILSVGTGRQTLTLASLGRDQASALQQGDIVEVVDDASELGSGLGHLTHLSSDPDPDQLTVTLADPLPARFRLLTDPNPPSADRHLILRRWDGRGVARSVYDGADLNLDNTVKIQFGGQDLRPGDYWNITTRSADGSVQALTQAPPTGIIRYRCPLAIVKWTPLPVGSPPASPPVLAYSMQLVQDCRKIFTPLTSTQGAEAGIHVLGLSALNSATGGQAPLTNDQTLTLSNILGGIDVLCDQPIDPNSISRPSAYFTLEIPFTAVGQGVATPLVAYQQLTIVGTVVARSRTISWRFDPNAANVMPQIVALKSQADRGVLCRLTLKGGFIWSTGDPRLFLDGDSFGSPDNSVVLPSGDQRRGGDFQIWFWVAPDPAPAKTKETEKTKETVEKISVKETDKILSEKAKEVEKIAKETDKLAEKIVTEKAADLAPNKTVTEAVAKPAAKTVAAKSQAKAQVKSQEKARDKTRDKGKEKTTEKTREKLKDKVKDRELAPQLGTISGPGDMILGDHGTFTTPPLGRHFIQPSERPEVGSKLLDDKDDEDSR